MYFSHEGVIRCQVTHGRTQRLNSIMGSKSIFPRSQPGNITRHHPMWYELTKPRKSITGTKPLYHKQINPRCNLSLVRHIQAPLSHGQNRHLQSVTHLFREAICSVDSSVCNKSQWRTYKVKLQRPAFIISQLEFECCGIRVIYYPKS